MHASCRHHDAVHAHCMLGCKQRGRPSEDMHADHRYRAHISARIQVNIVETGIRASMAHRAAAAVIQKNRILRAFLQLFLCAGVSALMSRVVAVGGYRRGDRGTCVCCQGCSHPLHGRRPFRALFFKNILQLRATPRDCAARSCSTLQVPPYR